MVNCIDYMVLFMNMMKRHYIICKQNIILDIKNKTVC